MAQLTFQWPQRPSYAPEDFIVASANEKAAHFLKLWPDGHSTAALLTGAEASGKTHLARNWSGRTKAIFIDGAQLGRAESARLWHGATHAVLEDIHGINDETALFHLLRHTETQGLFLLLTARMDARQLPFGLPDLRSRLLALPATVIGSPDEELLRMFLFKRFSDRQIRINDAVIDYLVKRMERSFSAADKMVNRLEEHALSTGKEITIPSIKIMIR